MAGRFCPAGGRARLNQAAIFGYRSEMVTKTETLETTLRRIEQRIQKGISSTATDGTAISVDLKALEREAGRLRSQISLEQRRRPKSGTMRIW